MKKNLWMLGVAVAALTSCTQNEVVEIPEAKKIGFGTFVENSTRAFSTVTENNIRKFYVIGYRSDGPSFTAISNDDDGSGKVFENQAVTSSDGADWSYTPAKYWIPNSTYRFMAYADGTNSITLHDSNTSTGSSTVEFDPVENIISFKNYHIGDNDLIVSGAVDYKKGAVVSGEDVVEFNFRHMLSVLRFTILNASNNSTLRFSEFKVTGLNNVDTGSFDFDEKKVSWSYSNVSGNGVLDYIDEYGVESADGTGQKVMSITAATAPEINKFVIPQMSNNAKLSFKVSVYDESGNLFKTETVTDLSLELPQRTGSETTPDYKWLNGYVYNYKIKVGEDLTKIVFTVDAVQGWDSNLNNNNSLNDDNINVGSQGNTFSE